VSDRGRRGLEVLAVALVMLLILALTAHHYGLGYDEPVYMSRAQDAGRWLSLLARAPGQALGEVAITKYWHARDQQPGFVKLLAAVATPVGAWLLPVLGALRAGTLVLVAALAASLYLFVGSVWGRVEALAAVAALFTMPRVFAHSHLLALDAPVMAATFITLHLLFLTARDRGWRWAALAGMVWGIALSCKVNGFFVPVIALPWMLLCARDALLPALICGATLGPATFLLSWPWLWHDTWARLLEYLQFHFKHWQIEVTYFGRKYAPAPWHYPIVMSAITIPPATMGAALVGAWRMVRERTSCPEVGSWRERWHDQSWRRRAAGALIGWGLAVNYVFACLPSTPKYTGCRLFLPVFPLVAVAAGVGIGWLARAVGAWAGARTREAVRRAHGLAVALVAVIALVGPLRAVMEFHPHELTYYNALIGGLPGADRHGMEVTYWGETYLDAAAWLNRNAPPGAAAWIEPPGCEATMGMYRRLGILRADIRTTAGPLAFPQADYAIFQNKVTEFSDIARRLLADQEPLAVVPLHGVPLLYVFDIRDQGALP
jgi:hypothetical protein